MDISISFIRIITFFDGAFEYVDGAKFCGYVGTNAEPLSVEFCNFEYNIILCKVFTLLLLLNVI
jgi:hypothetical protein